MAPFAAGAGAGAGRGRAGGKRFVSFTLDHLVLADFLVFFVLSPG